MKKRKRIHHFLVEETLQGFKTILTIIIIAGIVGYLLS